MTTKNEFFRDAQDRAQRRKNKAPYRKPLKTFAEIAEMLGVSEASLKGLLRYPFSPKPILKTKNMTNSLNYYDEDEFKTWWSNLSKEKNT